MQLLNRATSPRLRGAKNVCWNTPFQLRSPDQLASSSAFDIGVLFADACAQVLCDE